MLFDTHAHLNFEAFNDDWKEVIKRAHDAGIWVINVGSNLKTSKKAIEIAEQYKEGVYAAVGLHPIHVFDEEADVEEYEKLTKHPKVVAIGEIGLDYYHIPEELDAEKFKKKQKEVLEKFNNLSEKIGLPIIIHCREAHNDLINFFENKPAERRTRGVMHCFSGNGEEAKKYLDLNFLISFTGVITFKKYNNEVLRTISLDKLMVETDCPYLAPEPHRGERNEPLYVKYIIEEVARVKGAQYREVAKQTTENALKFFFQNGYSRGWDII